jgi:hypothetical protein
MKNFLALILSLTLALTAYAENPKQFSLKFEKLGDKERIIHNPSDWHYVGKEPLFFLSIEKGMIGYKNEFFEFHSVTEFYKPYKYQALSDPIYRVYSYGMLNCSEGTFYLLISLFVDKNNFIVFREYHDFGTYVSPLRVENTARQNVYDILCRDSV